MVCKFRAVPSGTHGKLKAQRKYFLKRTGSAIIPSIVKNKSVWTDTWNGVEQVQELEFIRAYTSERAFFRFGRGYCGLIDHPDGFQFPWLMPAPYARGHIAIDCPSQSVSDRWSDQWSEGSATYTGPITTDLTDRGDWSKFLSSRLDIQPYLSMNEYARLNTTYLLRMKDSKLNLGIFAAEFRKTVGTLANGAQDVLAIYRGVKKGDWRSVVKRFKPSDRKRRKPPGWSSKDASQRWLEVQYGWGPIINDVVGAYEHIADKFNDENMTLSCTANFREVVSPYFSEDTLWHRQELQGERGSRIKCHYLVDLPALREASRLGLLNPPQVIWDLIPFSFVVDWFFPVSNILEALDATVGLRFISGTRTNFCEGTISGTYSEGYDGHNGSGRIMPPLRYTGSFSAINRSTLATFPLPLPYFKNPFSGSHVVTALSLVRQFIRR